MSRAFSLTTYRQCRQVGGHRFFARQPFHTIHIDLTPDPQAILASFGSFVRRSVRRGEKDDIQCGPCESKDEFVSFYNVFAATKGRPVISRAELDALGDAVVLTAARDQADALMMHSHVVDCKAGRARLLHSASAYRNMESSERRNMVGRANRLLHYFDMLEFKRMGIDTYDFGGYAVADVDEEKARINLFKAGFGGTIVEESNFVSLPLHMAYRARDLIASLRPASGRAPVRGSRVARMTT